jgi:hypothetical protein
MEAALAALKSQKPGERINIAQTAKKYNVDRSTLSRRYRGVQTSHAEQYENQRLLNDQQESELVEYIDKLCQRGLPPTREMLQGFASEICRQPVGKNWPNRFINRHKLDLVSRWTTGLDRQRKQADSAFRYKLYFELLERKIKEYSVEPQHIYNMDEKGFLIGIISKSKRIFSRRRYEEGGVKQVIQDGNREWITCIACICADGSSLSPSLIYQAASGRVQDSWLQDFDPAVHQCFFSSSPNGWTSNELGLQWLQQVFDRETKKKTRRAYRLLILDGHGSHVSMSFIDYCDRNKILLAIYPPHSTHTLQPLDVCLFSPLAAAYSKELSSFILESMGFSRLTKRDFFRLFEQAWRTSIVDKNILSGFEKCGLQPFNPQRVLARFNEQSPERPSSSESSHSALTAEDWRRIDKLLRLVVSDICDRRARKLSNTVHSLATKNLLLQQENHRLTKALCNEKKKRQRKQPLLLEASQSYDGGAIFYSPNKVQQARDRQAQKEATAELLRQQKDEGTRRRAAEKLEKVRVAEEKRSQKAAQRDLRLQLAEQKRLEKEEENSAKEANRQLQNDIRASTKATKATQSLRTIPNQIVERQSAVDVVAPSAQKNRRGRAINLPTRFRG